VICGEFSNPSLSGEIIAEMAQVRVFIHAFRLIKLQRSSQIRETLAMVA
jgi:hypothetical protein